MKTNWQSQGIESAESIGTIELETGEYFEVYATPEKLIFGGWANACFLESGYLPREDGESLDASLWELHADLEVYYRDGARYVSRIICSERM